MAKNIANVDILTDTFNSWLLRTNEVIDVVRTDAITANSTLGVTGSVASPRHALLFGSFTANNFYGNTISLGTNFTANSSTLVIGTGLKLVANGTPGTSGQILTSDGTTAYWSTASGTGTVTQLANGAGIYFTDLPSGSFGSPITSYGTIRIRAGDGIIVDSRGISVNTQYLSTSLTNASTLQSRTWEIPGAIGATTANTGTFTTVTAGLTTGYRLQNDSVFLISNSMFRTQGFVDATTPNVGTTGAFRARGTSGGVAYIQVTDSLGSTEWGNFKAHSNGYIVWSGAFHAGSFSSLIPTGTVMLFAQTNAPTGWTKITTHDNKALRVVSGSASSGGTTSFTAAFNTQFTTDGHVLTESEMPVHTHSGYVGIAYGGSHTGSAGFEEGRGSPDWTSGSIGNAGAGDPHTHTLNFDVQYVDVILASKN